MSRLSQPDVKLRYQDAADIVMNSNFHRKLYKIDQSPLHDPCVIAYLIDPSISMGRHVNVQAEENSILTRGESVINWLGVTNRQADCLVMVDAEHHKFFSLLQKELKNLN